MSDTSDRDNSPETAQKALETPAPVVVEPPKERVGDLLKKERITRRITIESIAKDLKLNAQYIKTLEASEYDNLPADPYVRVYLRSIAKYLSLNPDAILQKFFEERGVEPTPHLQKDAPQKMNITMSKQEVSRNKSWIMIAGILALLAIISLIARHVEKTAPAEATGALNAQADTTSSVTVNIDSAVTEQNFQTFDSVNTTVSPTAGPDSSSIVFTMTGHSDSVWVQIFTDGESGKYFLRGKQTRKFVAHDSINVHVGNNSSVTYTLNGKQLSVEGKSVVVFKIDRAGIHPWKYSQWLITFKGRLE